MAEEILEHLEFLRREIESLPSPHDLASHEVHRQVVLLEPQDLIRAAAAQEGTNSRQQLRERKGFDEVVVGAAVESVHTIVDGVLGRQDQDGSPERMLAERGENLETVASRQHKIEDHKIERLVVHEEKPFLTRARDADLVVLGLEPITKGFRDLLFVFDD
jgi:hypothetical protein